MDVFSSIFYKGLLKLYNINLVYTEYQEKIVWQKRLHDRQKKCSNLIQTSHMMSEHVPILLVTPKLVSKLKQ